MSEPARQRRVRFTARFCARGLFASLVSLALTIALVSFLTACKCTQPFVR